MSDSQGVKKTHGFKLSYPKGLTKEQKIEFLNAQIQKFNDDIGWYRNQEISGYMPLGYTDMIRATIARREKTLKDLLK